MVSRHCYFVFEFYLIFKKCNPTFKSVKQYLNSSLQIDYFNACFFFVIENKRSLSNIFINILKFKSNSTE